MTAITLSFRLMAMVCHSSYPRNSDIASPPGTFAVYLSCAETAQPKTASHTIAIPIVSFLVGVIAAPHASRASGPPRITTRPRRLVVRGGAQDRHRCSDQAA